MHEQFAQLRLEYLAGAARRAEVLQSLNVLDPASLPTLREHAHKLRGSGGFYGYHTISDAAADLEEAVRPMLDGDVAFDGALLAPLLEALLAVLAATVAAAGPLPPPDPTDL